MESLLKHKINEIESVCNQDIGRNIQALSAATQGNLWQAARSITNHPNPRVALITGFFIPYGNPPAAETDGPVGTTQLAACLTDLNIPVEVVTDSFCEEVVAEALKSIGIPEHVTLHAVPNKQNDALRFINKQLNYRWFHSSYPISHIISIERVGPAKDGICRNMNGDDISEWTAPLHQLFTGSSSAKLIAIGDGGNEIGMGALSLALIKQNIHKGERIACRTPCHYLIIAGISNWGALALVAALTLLSPSLHRTFDLRKLVNREYKILRHLIEHGGAVDGVSGNPTMSVDGVHWQPYEKLVAKMLAIVANTEV